VVSFIQVKGKALPVHATKTCRGSRGIAPLILNLGDRWRWVGSITPWILSPKRNSIHIEPEAA
jgi:hypothetical protein